MKTKASYQLPPERHHSQSCKPIHSWFELSYAQYLTIPRSVLQSMPTEWQQRFVACLEELDHNMDWRPKNGCWKVRLYSLRQNKNGDTVWGKIIHDPLMDYERGRRAIPLKVIT